MTYSEKYADFILSLDIDHLDLQIINKAKELMIDTIGVALAGSQQTTVHKIIEGLNQLTYTKGDCSIWGHLHTFTPDYAAMINGISSHILDFDDTHTAAILHGSSILTPLCLTYGFSQCNEGKKIIKAFIAGWEIAARVGSCSKGTFHKRGFHSTAIAGIFGAVSSMSVILNLNRQQIINALGLAGSFASGVNEFLANGSNSKVMHVANVIKNSILISHLAKSGVTGPDKIFEGRDNIFKCFGLEDEININYLDKDLGKSWEILKVSLKPYPCCHFAHGLIDCIASLRKDGLKAEDINHITCFVDNVPINFICSPIEKKRNPTTEYEAKFAMPFLLALMFHDGDITLNSYKNLQRPEIKAFANKISYQERTSLEFPTYFPGHMEIMLKKGSIIKKDISINKGNSDNPLSKVELEQKFLNNTKGIITNPKYVLEYIYTLEQQTNMIKI